MNKVVVGFDASEQSDDGPVLITPRGSARESEESETRTNDELAVEQ